MTNLIITTNRRTYAVYLIAEPTVKHFRYGFLYATSAATPAPTSTPVPDFAYRSVGRAPFVPQRPYAVGGVMYLPLPGGTYDLPNVEARVNGVMEPVPHSFDPYSNTMVVQGLYIELELSSGDGKHRMTATVSHT